MIYPAYFFSIQEIENNKIINHISYMNGETIRDVYLIAYEIVQRSMGRTKVIIHHHNPQGIKKMTTILQSAKYSKSFYKYDKISGIWFVSEL